MCKSLLGLVFVFAKPFYVAGGINLESGLKMRNPDCSLKSASTTTSISIF